MLEHENNPKLCIFLAIKGFCLGLADMIPGVSGGTMAFILGIYEELIDAIKSFDRIWVLSLLKLDLTMIFSRPHLSFILPLVFGVIIALLFFTHIVPLPKLLMAYPEELYGLFFGLIIGSCFILVRETKNIKIGDLLFIFTGALFGLIIFSLGPFITPDTSFYIFLSGFLAISAMLLPGVSGSFILLVLNKYSYIFDAIGHFKLAVIMPFAIGILVGLVLFSRFLSWVLRRYYRNTKLLIIGVLASSLWVIWPFQMREYIGYEASMKLISSSPVMPTEFNFTFMTSLLLAIVGCAGAVFIGLCGSKVKGR